MLHCGCSTRDWLSPLGGLLELLVWARSWGLSTINGGWVPSLKCRGISEVLFSWKACVMSKSCTTTCGTKEPEKRLQRITHQKYCTPLGSISLACNSVYQSSLISVVHLLDQPPSLILLSVNLQLRHETPAPRRPPPSAQTACRDREPRGRYST